MQTTKKSAVNTNWVPVASELPDDHKIVLFRTKYGEFFDGEHRADHNVWENHSIGLRFNNDEITHWANTPDFGDGIDPYASIIKFGKN